MPQMLLLVMKNCVRNRVRTLLTILGISVGVIAFAFLQTVLAAYYIGAEASSPNRLVTRHRVSLFNLLPLSQKEKIEQIDGVKQVSWGMWFGGYYQDPKQFFGQIAIDDVMWDIYPEFLLAPEQREAFNKDLQGAVVGRKLAERYGWKIGDRITITGTIFSGNWDFIIDGIYNGRERTTDETTMYFHWKLVDERLTQFGRGSQVGWWVVGIGSPGDAGRISKDVDDLFINSSSPTLTETEKDFQLSFVAMMGTIITIIKMAAWIVIGIILLIMANTMAMAARERVTEYGVLKTLGFRAMHLGALIGGEALFVSFLGAAVGCAIAFAIIAVVGKFVEQNMGQIFPVFEMTPLTIGESIGLAMAAGLVACLLPMARAIRIPIADALRKVAELILGIPIVYNLRNLWVRKVTTGLTVAGIALAVGVLVVVMMLVHGLQYALVASGSPDNAIVLRKSSTSETLSGIPRDSVNVVKTLPEIAVGPDGKPMVTAECVVGVNLLRRGQVNARSGANVTMRGITPESLPLRRQVKIVEGRAPEIGKPEIMAGRNAAAGFEGCQAGGSISMGGLDWQVVGVFEADGSSFESELWGDADLLMRAFGREGGYSSVTFAMKDPNLDISAVQAKLDADPRLNLEIKREQDYYEASSSSLTMLISTLGGVLIVLFSFGAVMGAMVTMFAFVGSRTREIGTLRALGFPRRAILACFMIESMILSLAGGVVACIPALFLQKFTFSTTNFSTFTDVTWHFRATPGIMISGLVFAVAMGLLGGLIPAVRAARLPIITALREA